MALGEAERLVTELPTTDVHQVAVGHPYIVRTYDRWIILVIVLVAGWFMFRPIFAYTTYYRGLSFERMLRFDVALHYYRKSQAIYHAIPAGWVGEGDLHYMWAP